MKSIILAAVLSTALTAASLVSHHDTGRIATVGASNLQVVVDLDSVENVSEVKPHGETEVFYITFKSGNLLAVNNLPGNGDRYRARLQNQLAMYKLHPVISTKPHVPMRALLNEIDMPNIEYIDRITFKSYRESVFNGEADRFVFHVGLRQGKYEFVHFASVATFNLETTGVARDTLVKSLIDFYK